jgi:HPr kinase/phosphorylase
LIRGSSGAGKSSFAAMLLAQARALGEFAAWVADDRVLVTRHANRLVAAPHPLIAGRFEARGIGILSEPHEGRAVLRLLVDLKDYTERLPERNELTGIIAGVTLPRVPLVAGRIGMYEASLVVSLIRMRQEEESRPTASSRGRNGRYLTET